MVPHLRPQDTVYVVSSLLEAWLSGARASSLNLHRAAAPLTSELPDTCPSGAGTIHTLHHLSHVLCPRAGQATLS